MHFRSTIRGLLRVPSFVAAVVLTIALGVGATSAMFSVVYAVLLRPLPYPGADRLVLVWEKWHLKGLDPDVGSRVVVRDTTLPVWRAQNHVFEGVAGFLGQDISLTGAGEP